MLVYNLTNFYFMRKVALFLSLFLIFTAVFDVAPAFADDSLLNQELDSTDMTDLLCNALAFLTGTVGKTLAAFACIGVSLAFIGGKVAWTTVLAFSLGMACIFGAPQVVQMFAGGDKPCENVGNNG